MYGLSEKSLGVLSSSSMFRVICQGGTQGSGTHAGMNLGRHAEAESSRYLFKRKNSRGLDAFEQRTLVRASIRAQDLGLTPQLASSS